MAEVIVHGMPGSPYTRAALLGCAEKGVSYRLQVMSIQQMRSVEHVKLNPFARIPILEHGSFSLYETQAILRYIDDAFDGPALQPDIPREAARMNQVMGITDFYVFPWMSAGITWNRIIAPKFGMPTDEMAVQAALPKVQLCITALAGLLGSNDYISGTRVTLADLLLAPHLDFLPLIPEGAAMLKGTRLESWLERMRARPSMLATTWQRLAQAA